MTKSVDDPLLDNVPEDEKVAQHNEEPAPIELTSGGIIQLKKGQKVSAVNPTRPNSAYQGFVEAIFSEAAASLGFLTKWCFVSSIVLTMPVRGAILESKKTLTVRVATLFRIFAGPFTKSGSLRLF